MFRLLIKKKNTKKINSKGYLKVHLSNKIKIKRILKKDKHKKNFFLNI